MKRGPALALRIGIALVVIGGVVWWVSRDKGGSKSKPVAGEVGSPAAAGGAPKSDRVVPVQLAPVAAKDFPIWLEGLGTVTAFQQVIVRSQVDGRLDKVLFTEGQVVKAGEVIAQIDPRPFLVQLHTAQGALARDKAQLVIAKRNYERYQGLQQQQLVAQQQVDEFAGQVAQYEGAVKIDLAAVESAQLQLDYASVKAPFTGTTGVRLVDAGNLVKASDTTGLVVITAVDPAAVLFTIPQDRLPGVSAALAKGEVPVEVWNRDGTTLLSTGKLAVLDNQVNQATATLRLKAIVPNPERKLWPNAFVKARMLVETKAGALVIPAVAIQRGPQGAYVYVVGDDKAAQLRNIEVGTIVGDNATISRGLKEGERVVVEGASQLRPGGKVQPIEPQPQRGSNNTPTSNKESKGSGVAKGTP
jgi:multidrug efflux system membrane fusion protein